MVTSNYHLTYFADNFGITWNETFLGGWTAHSLYGDSLNRDNVSIKRLI